MKKILCFVISIALWICSVSYAAKPPFAYKISGVEGDILTSVQAILQAKADTITNWNSETINTFYHEIPHEIIAAVKPYGYFKASVTSNLINKRGTWSVIFRVHLGRPVKISDIDLKLLGEGAGNREMREAVTRFPVHKGEVFVVDKYNAAKQSLFDTAARNGYAVAILSKKEVLIDLENHTAKITLYFDTGPRYYFGSINIHAPYFSHQFLARFLPMKTGDTYSSDKIIESQDAFTNSNLFQRVDVVPRIAKNELHQVPVEVHLLPRKGTQYSFGAGYGTDTGIRGSLGVERRHLTPTGHSFKALVQASQVQNNLEMHYLIPGNHPVYQQYDISAAAQTLDLNNGRSIVGQIGFGYTTIIKDWKQAVKLSFQHEIYKLVDKEKQHATLLIHSANWVRSESDDPVKPSRGYSINVSAQGAVKYLASTSNFIQVKGDTKLIHTFFNRIQVLLHGTLGYTAINNIDNLPLSLQFYTGGTQSVRGYGYNSIGPGKNLLVGSAELRHKVVDDWYVAIFFDVGNVSDNLLHKPSRGVGIGVVWRTSVGSLELTYAKALDSKGKPARIQFTMGPDL